MFVSVRVCVCQEVLGHVISIDHHVLIGRFLGMTVPVVSNIHMMEDGNTFVKDVQTAFFLPAEFQTNPPQPSDPDVTIVHREPIRVVARSEHHHQTFCWLLNLQKS